MQACVQRKSIPANRYIPRSSRSPISCISNRYNKLLEFGVTYRKQTTDVHSKRYRYALSFARHSVRNFEKTSTIDVQSQLQNEVTAQ